MKWPIAAAGVLDILMALLLHLDASRSGGNGSGSGSGSGGSGKKKGGMIMNLRRFSTTWWLPGVVGLLSFVNTYTIVLSGPLTILYVSAVLGKPRRWFLTAFLNALGATLGVASLV